MIAKTHSATVLGVDAHCIDVEVDLSLGLSQFTIVGLPDGTIRESRDRILAALANSGFSLPIRKIVVNLAAPSPIFQMLEQQVGNNQTKLKSENVLS